MLGDHSGIYLASLFFLQGLETAFLLLSSRLSPVPLPHCALLPRA